MAVTHCSNERASAARDETLLVLRALRAALGEELRGRRVSVFGLGADPCARVSGLRLVEALVDAGAAVSAHDAPERLERARGRIGDRALLLDDAILACVDSDALVLTGAWSNEHRPDDLAQLRECMARPLLIDAAVSFAGDTRVGAFGAWARPALA